MEKNKITKNTDFTNNFIFYYIKKTIKKSP